jgi:ubiquinone/menaquinone biosynthesis C-methylase UbiE
MSSEVADPAYLRTDQYKDASNLDARARLHERFSTNQYGWHPWVFDRLDFPTACDVLELGCGPGYLWAQNNERIPEGWRITLSDLSSGMVQEARWNLRTSRHLWRFEVSDAQCVPFADESFDGVIANHMLYHVPDRDKALAEIRRVLRRGGRFCATTVGRTHLKELGELVHRFDPRADPERGQAAESFLLENGEEQISTWFPQVAMHRYEDALAITEAEPLVDYVTSTITWADYVRDRPAEFSSFVERELALHGAIHITKDSGILVAFG